MSIDIVVSTASLADVLGEMREWLDAHRLSLVLFQYRKDASGGAVIQVKCDDRDRDQAELFKARFQNRV